MRYESAAAVRNGPGAAAEDGGREDRITLARLRKRALALDFRLGGASRPTKDIDLRRDDDEEAVIEDIAAVQRLRLDDFFTFMASRTDAFDEVDEFQAIRSRLPNMRGYAAIVGVSRQKR